MAFIVDRYRVPYSMEKLQTYEVVTYENRTR